jgi:hypothetical protein
MKQPRGAHKDPQAGRAHLFLYQPGGRAEQPSWLPYELTRYIPAIGCIIVPFIILIFYQHTVESLKLHITIPPAAVISSNCPAPEHQAAAAERKTETVEVLQVDRQSADVAGRFGFSTTSAALRVLSLVGMAFGVFVILRRTSPITGTVTSIASLGLGLAVFELLTRDEGTRKTLVLPIMEARKSDPMFDSSQEHLVDAMVNMNAWFGFTAVVFILCALAVVAIRARDQELTPAVLRQRLFDLKWLMILAAAILVLTVVITRALIDWQVSFLCESYRDGLKPAGNALANYWGLGSSGVLLGALLPSYFSWSRDVAKWAGLAKQDASEKERQSLIEGEGLDFAPTASISALLTVAIPALSGPALELLKSVAGLAGSH